MVNTDLGQWADCKSFWVSCMAKYKYIVNDRNAIVNLPLKILVLQNIDTNWCFSTVFSAHKSQQFRSKHLRHSVDANVERTVCIRQRCCRRCSTGAAHWHVVRYRIHFLQTIPCRMSQCSFCVFRFSCRRLWFPSWSVEKRAHKCGRMWRGYSRGPLTAICCTAHLWAKPYWKNTFPFKFWHSQLSKHNANASICIVRTAHDHAASHAA